MNKKGQSLALSIMGLIFFIIIALTCVNFFFNEVDTARSELSCASPNDISDATKLLCLVIDLTIPYWIWIALSVGVGLVIVRLAL